MDDADLEKLTLKPGKLKPKFNRNVTDYEVVLNSGVKEIKLDPLTRDSNASWTIVGIGTERTIAVKEGSKFTLVIEVSAEDGSWKQYSIKVISLSSSSTVVTFIAVKDHKCMPEFNTDVYNYECVVSFYCSSVVVQTMSPDKNTKIDVIGSENKQVKLNVGATKVEVKVTSPDGSSTLSYYVIVRREKFLFPMSVQNFECHICLSTVHCPVSVRNDEMRTFFCEKCLKTVTRSNKFHPITCEALEDSFVMTKDDIDEKLSRESINCPFNCKETVKLAYLGEHIKSNCDSSFLYVDKVESIFYGQARKDTTLHETETCALCSRAVLLSDRNFHQKYMCTSRHTYQFETKVVVHKWESKYQQEILAQQIDDPIKMGMICEEKYLKCKEKGMKEANNKAQIISNLNNACQLYAYSIIMNNKDHLAHFRLAVVLEEIHHLQDTLGIVMTDSNEAVEEIIGEFQTAESMEDDIKALAELKGYGKDASITNQLKAVDEEYHFLLERGQSEKADYLQKLYAFKQKQQHHDKKTSALQSMATYLDKAVVKYTDAACVQPNNAVYQMHVGRCLLQVQKYDEAAERLRYAVALKPIYAEAKFYLGLAMLKSENSTMEYTIPYVQHGILYFIYHLQWRENKEEKMFAEKVGNLQNISLVQAVHELSKQQTSESYLFKQNQLLSLTSMLCFDAMNVLVNRGKLFKLLQSTALESQYDYGKYMMTQQKEDCQKKQLKKYWERLSNLTLNFCGGDANVDILQVQRKICEATVILFPCSSKTLYHLGDVLFTIMEKSPSSISVEDVERLFRCSIELEGKDMNEGEPSEYLKQTAFWKAHEQMHAPPKSTTKDSAPIAADVKKVKPVERGRRGVAASTPISKKTTASRSILPPKTVTPKTATSIAPKKNTTSKIEKAAPVSAAKGSGCINNPVSDVKVSSTDKSRLKTPSENSLSKETSSSNKAVCKANPTNSTPAEINSKSYQARIGLARVLLRSNDTSQLSEVESLYNEVLKIAPQLHDAYIELGEMLEKSKPMDAVDVYAKFPFAEDSSYDDAFLYGEIVRLLMKMEKYNDPRLETNMIALGRILGFSALEKYISVLDDTLKYSKLLCRIYAGVNRKVYDDPDLQAFFKFKCWV